MLLLGCPDRIAGALISPDSHYIVLVQQYALFVYSVSTG